MGSVPGGHTYKMGSELGGHNVLNGWCTKGKLGIMWVVY